MAEQTDNEWQQFLDKIEEYANHPADKWTTYTLLAYFLVKYRQVNGVDFVFSYTKRGPTKSRELKQASKIWEMFNKGRYSAIKNKEEKADYKAQLVDILKRYMDWAFGIKFRGRQTNITGLGIFAVSGFMNQFLQWYKANKEVLPGRFDPLPEVFTEWVKNNAGSILVYHQLKTYGDLNNLYSLTEQYGSKEGTAEYLTLQKARELSLMPKTGKAKLRR